MATIGLAPNPQKKEAVRLASELADWLTASGCEVLVTDDCATAVSAPGRIVSEEELADCDLLLILGGDGTMLRWARLAAPRQTPMLGVNFGSYGFITEIKPKDAQGALGAFLAGDYYLSDRVVLEATVTRRGRAKETYFALNEVVVSKGPLARMLGLHLSINSQFIVTYSADGIIVASPTGSTAYSLSAGGPVVHPNVSVIIVTPICPHTLSQRSLVVPDSEVVQIVGESGGETTEIMLTVDGQVGEHLHPRDRVEVRKAAFTAKLVQLTQRSFYDKLRTRLRWGERFS